MIVGIGLIISVSWTSTGGCGGATIVIEETLSSDELPKNAAITQYRDLDPDFQTAFQNAVEDLNYSRTHAPKTFEYRTTPADSVEYIHYENRYYKISALHGDCGMPEGVVLTVIPGVGLIAVAFIWLIVQAV